MSFFLLTYSYFQSIPYHVKTKQLIAYKNKVITRGALIFNFKKKNKIGILKEGLVKVKEQLNIEKNGKLLNLNNKQISIYNKLTIVENIFLSYERHLDLIEGLANKHKPRKSLKEISDCTLEYEVVDRRESTYIKEFLTLCADLNDSKINFIANTTTSRDKDKYLLYRSLFDGFISEGRDIEKQIKSIFELFTNLTSYRDFDLKKILNLLDVQTDCFVGKLGSIKLKDCQRKAKTFECYFTFSGYTDGTLINKYESTFQGDDFCYNDSIFFLDSELNLISFDKEFEHLTVINKDNHCFQSILGRDARKIQKYCKLKKGGKQQNLQRILNGYVVYNNNTIITTDAGPSKEETPLIVVGDFNLTLGSINIRHKIGLEARFRKLERNDTILCPKNQIDIITDYIINDVVIPKQNFLLLIGGSSISTIFLFIFRKSLKKLLTFYLMKLSCRNDNNQRRDETIGEEMVARNILLGYRA